MLVGCKDVDVCVVGYGIMPNRYPPVDTAVQDAGTVSSSEATATAAAPEAADAADSAAALAHAGAARHPYALGDIPAASMASAVDKASTPAAAGRQLPESVPDLSRHTYPEGGAGLTAVTPLHLAAGLGNAEIVCALLAHPKATAQLQQDHTLLSVFVLQTPLHLAVQAGDEQCVRLLLEGGHRVDVPSARLGHTALHRAAALGHVGITQLLLQHNVRMSAGV